MNVEKKDQNREHSDAPTIREKWLEDFLSGIDKKYFKDSFHNPLLRMMDERRKVGNDGVFNTSGQVFGRKNLGHLNQPAKAGDEYDPALMEELRNAYAKYHQIMYVLDKTVHPLTRRRKFVFDAVPLFAFLMRDFLTNESNRIVCDDPVIAALKLAYDPFELMQKATCKDVQRAWKFIEYIEKRMAAEVTSKKAQRCHEILPAEAERCGLPKEAVTGEWVDKVKLVYSLDDLEPDSIDLDCYNLFEVQDRIRHIESLIDDGQVFKFLADEGIEYGYFVLRDADDGRYFQQNIYQCYFGGSDLELLEDEGLIAAILDTGISPIFLTEEEIEKSERDA